jgi:allantoate deiminase
MNLSHLDFAQLALEALERCHVLARFSEEPDRLTRTFLSPPMRAVHESLASWMRELDMEVRIDAVGNLIGHYPGSSRDAPLFLLGSHVDTVRDAGPYDGILGSRCRWLW